MSEMINDQPLDLQAVEDEIRRCVSLCKAEGMRLQQGHSYSHVIAGRHPESVCLLASVAWVHRDQRTSLEGAYEVAEKVLGLSYAEGSDICFGFDCAFYEEQPDIMERPYCTLGKRLAEELL